MKRVQCYELFGGIALKNHTFSFFIYPSAELPSIFIKHFTNKVAILRANIASEHVTSTLVTGTTAATFLHLKKCHN